MGKYVSPEYQSQLDGLAETLCQPGEYEQSIEDFNRVFCRGVPEDFFELIAERKDSNDHFLQRFSEQQ